MVLMEIMALASALHLYPSSSGKGTGTVGSNRVICTNDGDEGMALAGGICQ